ncbi:ATP-binding protein [Protaetiibacter sp. SSC-01]|uniref:ATP-binding protein n=1 Tax=Protaetiibacter sp. SSC-01 TaxID=2759943 RepID=UPI00223B71BA|nr:ATP-binding protein [Protaetiibacter sp. SSC-01]
MNDRAVSDRAVSTPVTAAREIDPAPLVARLAAGPQPWVLLIDGRSGAGKTVLARRLAEETGATLVSLDDVYPGWDGLAAGAAAVPGIVRHGRWRRWDWAADAWGEAASVDRTGSLIVEGCGAISRASRPLADHAWWLDRDDAERKRRALGRDGDAYAPHWERWAAQEEAFAAAEHPRELADLVVRA